MPRVKIDYVVSFSNEDPDNQASNLLGWEVSKKKWLCQKGESSCSVVLQLAKAVQINSIQIGAYHSALVEVLVGRSESPNEPFQVLVPSSVFLTLQESRKDEPVEKVRSFTSDQLSADVRDKRWDRVRVVCSQPYNKHCKYGLSFIHISEPESKEPHKPETLAETVQTKPTAVPSRLLNLDNISSDEDEFKPGELFAKHQLNKTSDGNTDAQIRQASSQAIKNISDSATKLMKTPINRQNKHNTSTKEINERQDRQRNSLLYTDDDDQPHRKIDHIVNRHKDEKAKAEVDRKEKDRLTKKDSHKRDESNISKEEKHNQKRDSHKKDDSNVSKEEKVKKKDSHKRDEFNMSKEEKQKRDLQKRDDIATKVEVRTPQSADKNVPSSSRSKTDVEKRAQSAEKPDRSKGLRAGPISESPHTILSEVVFVLSGYENPRRAQIRDMALAMGARFERDWTPGCTHLICAFPNTPKLRTIRSSPTGRSAPAVTGDWIEECCSRQRLLPWQWYATENKFRVPQPDDLDSEEETGKRNKRPPKHDSDSEETPTKVKKRKIESKKRDEKIKQERERKSPQNQPSDSDTDVTFVKDERIQANVTISDSEHDSDKDTQATDEEDGQMICYVDERSTLPDFFEGLTFVIDGRMDIDRDTLCRYVTAYGGIVVDPSQMEEDSQVDYWLCAGEQQGVSGKSVRADWVWKCHENKKIWPINEYVC